jgi:hypothetical protein
MITRFVALVALFVTFDATASETWRPLAPGAAASDGAVVVTVVSAGEAKTVLEVAVRGLFTAPVTVDGVDYTSVSLHDGREAAPGKPAVPALAFVVALPRGATPALEVAVDGVVRLPGVQVAPAQPSPKRCGDGALPRPACDRALYGSRGPWPGAWAEVAEVGVVRDVRFARVVLHPVRALPSERASEVASRLRVTVTHAGGAFLPSPFVAPTYQALYRGLFVNAPALPDLAAALPGVERVLVVVPDALVEAAAPLLAWKRSLGFTVEVAPLSTVGTTNGAVKAFLQARYDDLATRPVHVLLVGDVGGMPTNHGIGGCASDFLYSLLDGGDLFSDVLVSRLSVKDAADLALQTQKIVDYEQAVPATEEADWLSASLCISSSEGDGASNDDVRSNLICDLQAEHGYAPTTKLFHSEGNDTAANITAAVEAGRGWITYLGHGSGFSWDTTSPPYASNDVLELKNPGRLATVMDVSCSNGGFDVIATCFAEAWMRANDGGVPTGAVAIYSASTPTAWDESAEMAVGLTRAFLLQGVHRWGALAFEGRAALIDLMGTGETVKETLQQYVVFGDSSLLMRSRRPVELIVDLPAVVPVGEVQEAVFVSRPDGGPAPRALVHLVKEGELDVAGVTDDAGRLDVLLAPATPGSVHVTVSAFDAVPWTGAIDVVVTGCGLVKAAPSVIACGGSFAITVWDHDLNATPDAADPAEGQVASSAGPSAPVTLTETGASTDRFEAAFTPASGGLVPAHGDTLTVSYADADCEGAATTVEARVTVDCVAPALTGVEVLAATATTVTLRWTTDEPATGLLLFGEGEAGTTLAAPGLAPAHEITVEGLAPSTTYAFRVLVTDAAGNTFVSEANQVTTPACDPDCAGKTCGPDGCGGSCGTCGPDQECNGQGVCFGGAGCETSWDGGCDGCACEACVCDLDPYCCQSSWDDVCIGECMNDCGGCGSCTPDCGGKACGPDGCGGSCGACTGENEACEAGACVCHPDCADKVCGRDGCGGSCGGCAPDESCDEGACVCVPACAGKSCGPDGCGGSCGGCADGEACGAAGACVALGPEPVEPDPIEAVEAVEAGPESSDVDAVEASPDVPPPDARAADDERGDAGGGGCALAPASRGSALPLALVLLGLALARRRRAIHR